MINSITIVGRLTKDVSLRYSESGVAIANFTVASNRPFKNAQGQNEADFIPVTQFRKGAELTAQYMSKGSLVGVTGRIQTRNYEKDGQRIFVTEVVAEQVAFLESKNKGNTGGFNQQGTNTPPAQQNNQNNGNLITQDPFVNNGEPIDVTDDDLPF